MDAQELKPGSSHGVRPLAVRLVVAWLAVVLAHRIVAGLRRVVARAAEPAMSSDAALLASMVVFAALIALPALAAASRRRAMREASDVAGALSALAVVGSQERGVSAARRVVVASVRSACMRPSSPRCCWRTNCRAPLRSCWRTRRNGWHCASSGAWPSNARCSRAPRPGRRRGAVAASIPPLALLALHAGGIQVPLAALLFVVAIEACGCWLLWRVARVEI